MNLTAPRLSQKWAYPLLLAAFCIAPTISYGGHIPADNLDSLVYMSKDIVVASLHVVKHPLTRNEGCENALKEHEKNPSVPFPLCAAGPNETETYEAKVIESLMGSMKPNESFEVDMNFQQGYFPAPSDGQKIILFLHPKMISPRPARWFFVDEFDHVRDNYAEPYYFTKNSSAASFTVEGYADDGKGNVIPLPKDKLATVPYATMEETMQQIKEAIAHVSQEQVMFNSENDPLYLALLRDIIRRYVTLFPAWNDNVVSTALTKLFEAGNIEAFTDALSFLKQEDMSRFWGFGLGGGLSGQQLGELNKILKDEKREAWFRTNAAGLISMSKTNIDTMMYADEVLSKEPSNPQAQEKAAEGATLKDALVKIQAVCTTILKDDKEENALRTACVPLSDMDHTDMAAFYRKVHTPELQNTIEVLFANQEDSDKDLTKADKYQQSIGNKNTYPTWHPKHFTYAELNAAVGPVISIVRLDNYPSTDPTRLAVRSEWQCTRPLFDKQLSYGYVLISDADGKHYPVQAKPTLKATYHVDRDELAIPADIPPGKYQLALEFSQDGKVISTGHGLELSLPLPPTLLNRVIPQANATLFHTFVHNISETKAPNNDEHKREENKIRELRPLPDTANPGKPVVDIAALPAFPLHNAALRNNAVLLLSLIKKGANINEQNADHQTALHLAAASLSENTLNVLLEHHADPNPKDSAGDTPLLLAINSSSDANHEKALRIVQKLVGAGADVNASDVNTNNPVILAIEKRDNAILRYLVEHGAKLTVKNPSGELPLQFAVRMGADRSTLEYLIEQKSDVNSKSAGNMRVLHTACQDGRVEAASVLLEHGAKIDAKDQYGNSCFTMAAKANSIPLIELLLKKGYKPKDGEAGNAMSYAAMDNRVAMADWLRNKFYPESQGMLMRHLTYRLYQSQYQERKIL